MGYFLYSLDAAIFHQLTTSPTKAQGLALADGFVDEVEVYFDEYEGEDAADPKKWPLRRAALGESIRKRLAAPDWYADLTAGDRVIWDGILDGLTGEPGETIGIDFRCENDGILDWDTATLAANQGASMMADPRFAHSGYRCAPEARVHLGPNYSFYLPPETRQLLEQLENVSPHFPTSPKGKSKDPHPFFQGLLEPVRRIVKAGRVMQVCANT